MMHHECKASRQEFACDRINYFPDEPYNPDPNDSTMAIPYTVLKSVGLFLTAGSLLLIAEVFCAFGHCRRRRRFFTFASGIVFIVSGLLMMLGIVMYISTLKGEVAEKLRPRSTFKPPLFSYNYGFSFMLIILGFLSTEVTGTCAIFLYIYWHKRDWTKKDEHRRLAETLEEPPPCLQHARPRRYSFHAGYPPATSMAATTPRPTRSRSYQHLDHYAVEYTERHCPPPQNRNPRPLPRESSGESCGGCRAAAASSLRSSGYLAPVHRRENSYPRCDGFNRTPFCPADDFYCPDGYYRACCRRDGGGCCRRDAGCWRDDPWGTTYTFPTQCASPCQHEDCQPPLVRHCSTGSCPETCMTRDYTCNTLSTTADVNRDLSAEFEDPTTIPADGGGGSGVGGGGGAHVNAEFASYNYEPRMNNRRHDFRQETLRRTTPV